jgi:hypothetical protein
MKLTAALVDHALSQFDAQPIPQDHPVVPRLANTFGDHTFFLNDEGLLIIERADQLSDGTVGKIVKLASWSDADHNTLAPHRPEETDVLVGLALGGSGPQH